MNTNISFLNPVKEDIQALEAKIKEQVEEYHPDLGAAMNILLSAGGKRIRPSLTITVGKMLGAPIDRLITLAASIELLHTATLVHDDLIDNSLLRRGNPTLNSLWAPDATVLTGDFLFAAAAKLAAEVHSLQVMDVFAKTLMTIVNGEIAQMFSSRSKADLDDYNRRIYAKTASLFETSAYTPALISPVEPELMEKMRRFGRDIGNAFQIIDDILDFTGDPEVMGKPAGSDLRHGLITLPTIYFIEDHPDDENMRYLLNGDSKKDEERIKLVIESISQSNAIQKAHGSAVQLVESGLSCLEGLPDSIEKNSLISLARYIADRDI